MQAPWSVPMYTLSFVFTAIWWRGGEYSEFTEKAGLENLHDFPQPPR